MVSNKLAIVFIGALCMFGAAGGAYIATRQNAVPASASAASTVPGRTAAVAGSPAAKTPVQETEAVVSDAASKRPASPVTAAKSASRREAPPPAPMSKPVPPAKATNPVSTTARNQDPAPSLDRIWPSNASSSQSGISPGVSGGSPGVDGVPSPVTRADEHVAPEHQRRRYARRVGRGRIVAEQGAIPLQEAVLIEAGQVAAGE